MKFYTFKYYFYNELDKNGKHEVHAEYCRCLPKEENRTYIGEFSNCKDAIAQAKLQYPNYEFDGCWFCSKNCHKG